MMASQTKRRKLEVGRAVSPDDDEDLDDKQFEDEGDEENEADEEDEDEGDSDVSEGDLDAEFGMYLAGEDGDEPGILGEDDGDADSEDGSADTGEAMASGEEGNAARDMPAGTSGRPARTPAKFTEGEKGSSFAQAFAKAMKSGEKKAKKVARPSDVILASSSTLVKRKAEEAVDRAERKAARKLRMEMKTRGHVKVARKGDDPEHDQREKSLMKLATRGVVLLFNAVAKAQKQAKDAKETGAKPQRLNKASFLAMLRGQQKGASSSGATTAAAAATTSQSEPAGAPGWDVLHDGFTGLASSGKMKDWDRQADSDDAGDSGPPDGMGDSDSGDDDDDGAW